MPSPPSDVGTSQKAAVVGAPSGRSSTGWQKAQEAHVAGGVEAQRVYSTFSAICSKWALMFARVAASSCVQKSSSCASAWSELVRWCVAGCDVMGVYCIFMVLV